MDASKSITAVFNAIPTYDLYVAANPFGYGTVTRNPDAPSYLTGTVVELTASPNENYTFTGWSGDLTGTTNPQSITMDGDRTVQANFELACSPNLYEPNQTLAAAWALPTVAEFDSPAAYSARIVPAGDFDFYRVYFEEGSHTCFPFTSQDFTIEVELSPPTGLDYDLYLYADDGTLLDSSMNGGSTSEYIRYDYNGTCTIDDSIYLYIEVRPWSGYWGCGEYTLTLDMSSQ
jgi:uncharacterized repeat protein (TIGR02543 family)